VRAERVAAQRERGQRGIGLQHPTKPGECSVAQMIPSLWQLVKARLANHDIIPPPKSEKKNPPQKVRKTPPKICLNALIKKPESRKENVPTATH
jgi:hypothetical protein